MSDRGPSRRTGAPLPAIRAAKAGPQRSLPGDHGGRTPWMSREQGCGIDEDLEPFLRGKTGDTDQQRPFADT